MKHSLYMLLLVVGCAHRGDAGVARGHQGDLADPFANDLIPLEGCGYIRIQFENDSAELLPKDREHLVCSAWKLKDDPQMKVIIEGHADERGTREYNIALGAKRAQTVRNFLAQHGISASRIRTVSYGKERPVAVCNDISCWSQNRRAQTVLNSRHEARS